MPEAENTVSETVSKPSDITLTTPQESAPLENASEETAETISKEIKEEITSAEACEATEETVSGETTVHKINARKLGTLLTAGALCVFSVGAIGIFGLANRGTEAVSADETANAAATVVTSAAEKKVQDSAVSATMSWWKAGVDEYDFISVDEDIMATTTTTTTAPQTTTTTEETTTEKTTTTTKKAVTTTTKATTKATTTTTAKKTEYTAEKIEKTVYYLTDNVNLRKGAGTNYGKITTLKKGTAVTATHKCSNGWFRVEVGDKTGYIIDDYITTKKPVVATTTTAATTTAKPAETEAAPSDDKTETAEKTPVIKYTDEELQMFYYVVEGEVGGCSEQSKLAVANVIINRVKSSKFSNSLTGVLTAKGQFTAINNYYSKRRTPTASTKDCVNRALYGEDNSKGAIYFYSKKYCSQSTANWFESLTFCLEIDGQRYFK